MPRFAANLSFLYTERDFLVRFAAARKSDGRVGCEYKPSGATEASLDWMGTHAH